MKGAKEEGGRTLRPRVGPMMMSEDMSMFSLMLKYLKDNNRTSEVQSLQKKIQQGNYAKEDAMVDFPGLPWGRFLEFINSQHKTVQPVVLASDPPAKRGRVDSGKEDSDDLDGDEDEETHPQTRTARQRPNSFLNQDNVNIRWIKLARPRSGEKLSNSTMEALSQGVAEYMKKVLEGVYTAARNRENAQMSRFENIIVTSNPAEKLREVEEREKEERKEQLRQEQQAKQRKRTKEGDINQSISEAMNTGKRSVIVPDIEMPMIAVREVVTLRDVISVLESDSHWRKSAFLQRLYSCPISDRPQFQSSA